MRFITGIFALFLMLASVACGGSQKESQGFKVPAADQIAFLKDVADKQWNGLNLNDASILENEKEFLYLFANWADPAIALYEKYGVLVGGDLIERMKGNNEMVVGMMEAADKMLRDPNSMFRCEELYISMLEAALATDVEAAYKERYQAHLDKALKNRKGSVATDFSYTTDAGAQGTLHGVEGEYTLLYFFNPDCHDCARVTEVIATSQAVNNLINAKRLCVLALYPDEDMAGWDNHQGENPKQWITARYTDLSEREKYDRPAIPNLYLLDKDKKVIFKDGIVEEMIDYLAKK